MIQSIFDFTEKTVGEIITPRVDIISLKSDDTLDIAMDIISKKKLLIHATLISFRWNQHKLLYPPN